jgi:hypothetical protein
VTRISYLSQRILWFCGSCATLFLFTRCGSFKFKFCSYRVLEPFLIGFETRDLSLSFLSGKAALRDLEVNVDAVNEKLNEQPGVIECFIFIRNAMHILIVSPDYMFLFYLFIYLFIQSI